MLLPSDLQTRPRNSRICRRSRKYRGGSAFHEADSFPNSRNCRKREHVHQTVLFRKFRIRALRKMVSRSMVLFVVRLGDVAEACRMLCVQLSVLFPHPVENLVDQPHVKAPVQVKDISRSYKSRHKKARDELLQLLYRRMVRQQRIQREDHDTAVDREGMAGLFPTVVGKLLEVFIILAAGRLPELLSLRFFVSRVQSLFYFRAKFRDITQLHMFCHKSALLI